MRLYKTMSGSPIATAGEYPIVYNDDIKEGTLVKLSGGVVVEATGVLNTDANGLVGVTAENHTGAEDPLNGRNNGEKILVYDNPEAVFAVKAPIFTASGGSATTVTAADTAVACSTADAFNGGFVRLAEKTAGSTNTDQIGQVRKVGDYAQASDVSTFTVASGGTANSGDKYEVYPPIGAKSVMALDSTARKVVLTTATLANMVVVGHDMDKHEILLRMTEVTGSNAS